MSDEQTKVVVGDRWLEAVIWHAHLREASDAELQHKMNAWKAWEADAENREIFDAVGSLYEDGSQTRERQLPNSEEIGSDPDNSAEPLAWRPPPDPQVAPHIPARRTGRSPRLRLMVSAGVAAAFVGVLVSLPSTRAILQTAGPVAHPQTHQTALGEIRSDRLQDGSVVTLGAQSTISVELSAERRSVRLERGEAWFQVAHDTSRPFVVTAGAGTITAVGTAFVVQKRAEHVVVTVTEGAVEVAARTTREAQAPIPSALHPRAHAGASRVARGEQMSYVDGGSASAVEHVDPQAATAWSEGQLEFDHIPLREVVQVVNRYSRRTIAVDQSSGNRIFTGLVLQNQIHEWVRRLAAIYPVDIVEHGDEVCVHARNQASVQNASPCGNGK